MKNKLPLVALFLIFYTKIDAQSWQRIYGAFAPYYYSNSAACSYDKGVLIPLQTNASLNSLLLKTDVNGNILWKRFTDSVVTIEAVYSKNNGDLILGGNQGNRTAYHSFLMELNACGDTLWTTIILDSNSEVGFISNIKLNSNGDILALGYNYGLNNAEPTILFCLDSNGKFKWKYADGSTTTNVLINKDKSMLLSGMVYMNDSDLPANVSVSHTLVTLIDSSGKRIWSNIYGHYTPYKYGEFGIGFHTQDKGYVTIHANADENYLKEGNFYAIKFDSIGNKQWVRYFGDSTSYESMNDAVEINDSVYISVGGAMDTNTFISHIRVMKINSSGKILSRKDFTLGSNCFGVSIVPTYDGKFIVCSPDEINGKPCTSIIKIDENMNIVQMDTNLHFKYDSLCSRKIDSTDTIHIMHHYTLIKADTMHFLYSGLKESDFSPNSEIKIYPNPAQAFLTIEGQGFKQGIVEMCCRDLLGRAVFSNRLGISSEGRIEFKMNINSLESGMYFIEVLQGGKRQVNKLIKQ